MPLSVAGALGRAGIILFLLLVNAFFVAAELSLVGAKRVRIEALARAGNWRAAIVERAMRRLDANIVTTQLGVTFASLGLGWVAEDTAARLLRQIAETVGFAPSGWAIGTIATVLAFSLVSALHLILGEILPKAIALTQPEASALWTAPLLNAFAQVFRPAVVALTWLSRVLLERCGLKPPHELQQVHRPEEIQSLLDISEAGGAIEEEPAEMIRGVFELSETTISEVMTPRTDVEAVSLEATPEEAAELVLASGHSRLPVYGEDMDDIRGMVIAHDVWRATREGKPIRSILRDVPFVPETKTVQALLPEMQAGRVQIAVVVDEFGGTAGIVTMEDLVEEIVGEIWGENETDGPDMQETAQGHIALAGAAVIDEFREEYEPALPEGDYTTIGGFIMHALGRIPEVGDRVETESGALEVLEMSGRRVERVLFRVRSAETSGD